ncbi:Rho GTPase activation protein [Spinellus fusiger]|nr:Rho GTPase activation protein [Spinellus fusiger]
MTVVTVQYKRRDYRQENQHRVEEEESLVLGLGTEEMGYNDSSPPASPTDSSYSHLESVEEEDEFGSHLSFYIQEKLVMYRDTLKQPPAMITQHAASTSIRARPSSPSSLISIPFLNKPRVVQRYSSLDSIIIKYPISDSGLSCGLNKGHLLLKKNTSGNSTSTWTRLYFFIQRDTGLLMQQPQKEDALPVISLKHATVRPVECEKRDYVIQLILFSKEVIMVRREPGNLYGAQCDKTILKGTAGCKPCNLKQNANVSLSQQKADSWYEFQAILLSDGTFHLKNKDTSEDLSTQHRHHTVQLGFLQRHKVYTLSDSVYNRPNCFAIFISPLEIIHIKVNTVQERDQWLTVLKVFCIPDIISNIHPSPETFENSSGALSFSHSPESFSHWYGRTLSITIIEGRHLHMNSKDMESSELYCSLMIDNEKRGATGKLRKIATPFWRESFLFTDFPMIRQGVTIHIISRNVKSERETKIGSIFIPSEHIGFGTTNEVWHDIRKQSRHRTFASLASLGYAQSYASAGELKVGTRLEEHIVLPLSRYEELVEFLKEFHNDSIYEIARKNLDLEVLTTHLVRIYEGLGLSVSWIKSLIDFEVASMSADDTNILFRGNSLLTKVIDAYMKMVGKNYLEEAIGNVIHTLCSTKVHIEVDLSKMEKGGDVTMHCEKLARYVQLLWTSIEVTKLKCPEELRQIFSHLQSVIIKKFELDQNPESPKQSARYTCVSGFLFLRLICPAIVSPKLFGIVRDHPDSKTSRTLTLLAKCLMNLANLVDPSSKEPWMKHLNQFSQISKSFHGLLQILKIGL